MDDRAAWIQADHEGKAAREEHSAQGNEKCGQSEQFNDSAHEQPESRPASQRQ